MLIKVSVCRFTALLLDTETMRRAGRPTRSSASKDLHRDSFKAPNQKGQISSSYVDKFIYVGRVDVCWVSICSKKGVCPYLGPFLSLESSVH